MSRQQIADIIKSITDLSRGEGADTPIGQGFGFVDAFIENLLKQLGHAHGKTKPDQPGGNLDVEQFGGGQTNGQLAKANLFPASVNHHFPVRFHQELPKRFDVFDFDRVDEDQFLGGRDLNQTDFGLVGVFADEFRVQGDKIVLCNVHARTPEVMVIYHDAFGQGIHSL